MLLINFSSLIEKLSIIPFISFSFTKSIFFLSDEFTINDKRSKKASSNPSFNTLFLSKFNSNGLDISMLLISNALT